MIEPTKATIVRALENGVKVPVDTLGVVLDTSVGMGFPLILVEWYMDQPGRGTRRVMRESEIVVITEG